MKFLVYFVLTMASVQLFAQTALVVPLSPDDTARYKRVHQEMLDAIKRWNDIESEVRDKYLILDKSDPDVGEETVSPAKRIRKGWESGTIYLNGDPVLDFEFTRDFKFIVPSIPPPPVKNNVTLMPQTCHGNICW
jgi:hypothetical protein